MSSVVHPAHAHPVLGRMAVELEQSLRTRDVTTRQTRWDEFERAVLEHMHEEEVHLLATESTAHRDEVEALLVEHHEIRCALVRGRVALAEVDAHEALLAIASFRLHQIREESGVHQHLLPHAHQRASAE